MAALSRRVGLLSVIAVVGLASCGPTTRGGGQGGGATSAESQPARTLVAAVRLEPTTLALRPLRETFAAPYLPNRMFNAEIAVLDDQAVSHPYLVEALPQLYSSTWRVFPDGRMETTYAFRPNLSWHDGTAFSAEDFVFGWRVYTAPELGHARTPPFNAIEDVVAPDARTLVIRWSQPYPDAAHMVGRDRQFPALPRHVLAAAFETEPTDSFANHSFWSREYVGLGPYRVLRWEPGAFIETAAFEAHATGRPRIDRVRMVFIPDVNTVLANMLAGEAHLAADNSLQFEHAVTLKREWDARQGGSVIWHFNTWRGSNFQFRQAFAKPEALLDLRVRRALAHAVDRSALNDALYAGIGYLADFLVPPLGEWGLAAQRGVVNYAYEPRRAEQLMREAGFERGPDGVFTSPLHGRLAVELKVTAGPDNEKEVAALWGPPPEVVGWLSLGALLVLVFGWVFAVSGLRPSGRAWRGATLATALYVLAGLTWLATTNLAMGESLLYPWPPAALFWPIGLLDPRLHSAWYYHQYF